MAVCALRVTLQFHRWLNVPQKWNVILVRTLEKKLMIVSIEMRLGSSGYTFPYTRTESMI